MTFRMLLPVQPDFSASDFTSTVVHGVRTVRDCVSIGGSAMLFQVPTSAEERAEGAPRPGRMPDPLRALAFKAASGDQKATHALVMELGGSMLRTVRKVLGAYHPDVEDVTQEALMGFLQSLPNFRGECTIGHFANRVAMRRALHARRHFVVRDRVGELSGEVDDPPGVSGKSETSLDKVVSGERRRAVRRLLGQLSEPVAESLAMHFMLGYTVDEIAITLEISPNTVWSRLKLGKKALRRTLSQDRQLTHLLREGEE